MITEPTADPNETATDRAGDADVDEQMSSRRRMLRTLALGAAGAAAAGAAVAIGNAGTAAAADGEPLLVGTTNTHASATNVNYSGATQAASFNIQSGDQTAANDGILNGLFAEAVSAAEIRHGPLALAGPNLRVLMFAQSDASFVGMRALKEDLGTRGCRVLFVCSDSGYSPAIVSADSEPTLELLAMLNRFYLAANASAVARGRSPDHPPLLSKVTETR